MWKTFIQGRKLEVTYHKNQFIRLLRSIPFLGRLIPYSAYGNMGFTILGMIYAVLNEIFSFFIYEIFYVGFMIGLPIFFAMWLKADAPFDLMGRMEFQMFVPLTLIGGMLKSSLFDPSEDKYYGVVLMRMRARDYALTSFLYYLVKKMTGFTLVLFLTGLIFQVPVFRILLSLLFWLAVKCLGAWIEMNVLKREIAFQPEIKINKRGKIKKPLSPNTKWTLIQMVITVLLLLLTYAPLVSLWLNHVYDIDEDTLFAGGIPIFANTVILTAIMLLLLPLGIFSAIQIWRETDYQRLYKRLLTTEVCADEKRKTSQELRLQAARQSIAFKEDDAELHAERTKSGYAYFHDIFVRRHKGLLKNRAKWISIVILLVGGILLGWLAMDMEENGNMDVLFLMQFIPILLYAINTGESLTQAMYVNCDKSMLTYNFYRKRSVLLGVFRQRLKTLICINLIPAGVLALVFVGAEMIFGAGSLTHRIGPALILASSVIAFSIFFSVHRLVMYYLLQPYNEVLKVKSMTYKIVNVVTYVFCYMLMSVNFGEGGEDAIMSLDPYMFAVAAIGFCVLYVPVALFLVNRFAPKTFRIRADS